MLRRCLGALAVALVSGSIAAQSPPSVQLAPTADCQTSANVQWWFTYTTNPVREFGRITNGSGLTIGSYEIASTLTGGTFNRTWQQPITLPQPPDTLIGSYGSAGDNPPTSAGTSEFFVLYNCTTKQVLYSCTGSYGSCPTSALEGIAKIAESIPATSPAPLAALLLALFATGALALRRRTFVRR
jgi:hypothetical protein